MDRERQSRLKLIVRNLKLLIEALESEVYSDVDAYKPEPGSGNTYSNDGDDDGYPD